MSLDRAGYKTNAPLRPISHSCLSESSRRGRVNRAIGNGQAGLGENAVNDLFGAIVVQRVQRIAPAREIATQERGLVPCGVFLVLGMERFQKKFALRYQSIDSFCILH